jgi:glycosyltransferase involved in cell wall biosynthesis
MKRQLAVFMSHPIQHFSPWWQELARNSDVDLKVYYYSRANMVRYFDKEFGLSMSYDIDLLSGYEHVVLPRQWPFRHPTSVDWYMLNAGVGRAVRERSWDAVLVFGYAPLNNWAVVRAARRAGVPILYYSDSNQLTEGAKPSWKLAIKRLVVRRYLRRMTAFLTPGNMNQLYLQGYGASPERMWFCPLPVDVDRFRSTAEAGQADRDRLRARFGLAPTDFVVAFNGKLVDRKRPVDLADAVRSAGDPGLKALFIGTGPLVNEIKARGGDCVRVTGFVNQAELPSVLALADLAVMPSSHDPHPLAVTEFMALGIPAVVSDRIGCIGQDDVVRPGETGLVYPCGDVAALTAAVFRLRRDGDLRRQMGRRAAAVADTQTPRVAADAVVRCLEGIRRPGSTTAALQTGGP